MQAVIASLVGQASRSVLSCRRGRSPVAAAWQKKNNEAVSQWRRRW
jgi:hypothetical protein